MGARSISMAIECKSLQKSCPLLVSRIPRHPNESFHFRVYVQHRDGHHFPNVVRSDSARVFYAADEMVGKSLAQVGKTVNGSWTDSDADLHDKWTQALNSSVELFEAEMRLPFHEVAFAAVVPCLVVSDDTLWTVDYESDGSIKGPPEPADEVTYFVGRAYSTFNPVAEFTISHLHIFTERGMRNRLTELEKGCPWWTTLT